MTDPISQYAPLKSLEIVSDFDIEILEGLRSKCLSEHICALFGAGDVIEFQLAFLDLFSHKIVIYRHVFHLSMKRRICCKLG